eukprot:192935_1
MAIAYKELNFKNEGEMWLTEIVLWISFILIFYLLIKILYYFCIRSDAPRFKQYDQRSLKKIKTLAEESRQRRISQMSQTSGNDPSSITNTKSVPPLPNSNGRVPSTTVSLNKGQKTKQNMAATPEEFQLQICKIHRSLRIVFCTSLISTAL